MAFTDLNYAERIQNALAQYEKSRHLQPNQDKFLDAFRCLQQWQTRRLMTQYKPLLNDPNRGKAAHFLLYEVYGTGHLGLIAHEIHRTAAKAGRLLPKGVLETAALALELNALTIHIDEILVTALYELGYETDQFQSITSQKYVAILKQYNLIDARRQQLDLCHLLARSVDKYLHSRSVRLGLRMSGSIAQSAGVINLHQFLVKAFAHLREVGRVVELIQVIGSKESGMLNEIQQGQNPYKIMDKPAVKHIDSVAMV